MFQEIGEDENLQNCDGFIDTGKELSQLHSLLTESLAKLTEVSHIDRDLSLHKYMKKETSKLALHYSEMCKIVFYIIVDYFYHTAM